MLKNRTLYFGDNLRVLREKFPPSEDGYFDLIYLDPPFNSKRDYNVLYKEGGADSPAQIHAFEDTWHWTAETEAQFNELVSDPRYPQKVGDLMQGFLKIVGKNDMLAYLTMMAARLVELHAVLKPTGSIYLHCDPTASHYLKLVMDAIFGAQNFLNEVVWKRTGTHSSAKRWGPIHDVLIMYARDAGCHTWNRPYVPLSDEHLKSHYRLTTKEGRRYEHGELTGAGTRNGRSGVPWRGFDVTSIGRHWTTTVENLEKLYAAGRIYLPKDGGWPRLIRYEDESKGRALGDVWEDIAPINMRAQERLGYPTQKPVALLERIVAASSNKGDWVLDPFGGCGTTAAAAEKLGRNWVIIDVTTLAINLVKRRLQDAYPDRDLDMTVDGYPADLAGARALFEKDPFEFEYWCCDLVNARPAGDKRAGKMKGADRGIDGVITLVEPVAGGKNEYHRVLVQVKGGEHVSAPMVRDLEGTRNREKAVAAVLITMTEPTKPMLKDALEAGSFTYALTGQTYPRLQILTVQELLDGKKPDLPNVVNYAKQAPSTTEAPGQEKLL